MSCNNRIKLRTSDNDQRMGFILDSNEAMALGHIGWAIEKHLDEIQSKLSPTFREILDKVKTRKEDLERP